MPLDKTRCSDAFCHEEHDLCPNCGGHHVTPRENRYLDDPSDVVDYGVDNTDNADVVTSPDGPTSVEYTHLCWDCGWEEAVTVTVERTTVSPGSSDDASE